MAKQILGVGAVIACIVTMTNVCLTDAPHLISFQGKLYDNTGNPLTGEYEIIFRLYTVESGGTSLWSETINVHCEDGLYSTILGQKNLINIDFNGQYWLGVQVTGDDELSPRYRLASVPTALRAQVANQVSWTNLTDIPAGFADGNDDVGAAGGVSQIKAGPGMKVSNPTGPTATVEADFGPGLEQVAAGNHTHDAAHVTSGLLDNARLNMGHGNGLDADLVDGKHASQFADSDHHHDDRYYTETELNTNDGTVNEAGDVVSWFKIKDMPAGFADGTDNEGASGGGGGWIDDGTVVRLETKTDRVGIGTTEPLVTGHVQSSSISLPSGALHSDKLILEDADAIWGLYSNNGGSAGSAITLGEVSGGALSDKWSIIRETATGGKGLRFTYGTDKDQFKNSHVMYLDDSGDVGIGTRSPDAKLGINGDLKVTGAYKGDIASSSGTDGAPFPRPAYDSGWRSINAGQRLTLIHNIGGNVNNYVVDMQVNISGYISNYKIGGDHVSTYDRRGTFWEDLTNEHIDVRRFDDDTVTSHVRIRIWVYK